MELFLQLVNDKKLDIKSLITDIFPVDKANEAYKKLEKDPINTIGVLLQFSSEEKPFVISHEEAKPKAITKKLLIGLIGCGAFAQGTHLPLLLSNKNCKVKAISTKSKKTAEICLKKYHPDYVTTNYKKILNDPEIKLVFIYTRHNTHKKFSVEALKAGKNVYIEKPMAITMKDCLEVYNTVKEENLFYTIGFNRRYSPFIKIAKNLLKERNNPIIINYRIASTFLSGDHWVYDPEIGGGPIIGELCHFMDLILYLMNSTPEELIARGGHLSHKNTELYDSSVVILGFENGSIANIIYTDLNGPDMPKERIEIFSGDSSIIINDFIDMKTSGFDYGNLKLNYKDKGHKNEIDTVINANLGLSTPLVSVNDALKAMDLCFKTIDSIRENKPIMIKDEFYD